MTSFLDLAESLGVTAEDATAVAEAALKDAKDRKLARQAGDGRVSTREAKAKLAEAEAKLATATTPTGDPDARHRIAIREALDSIDFVTPADRRTAVESLTGVSRLTEDGTLELFDPDDERAEPVPADDAGLRSVLPGDKVLSRAGGGSGASKTVPEVRTGGKPASDEFRAALGSQRAYEKSRSAGHEHLKKIEQEGQ
ncbi:MAG: hypothetical protein ABI682_08595 [Acidobacteriota bacterium]